MSRVYMIEFSLEDYPNELGFRYTITRFNKLSEVIRNLKSIFAIKIIYRDKNTLIIKLRSKWDKGKSLQTLNMYREMKQI